MFICAAFVYVIAALVVASADAATRLGLPILARIGAYGQVAGPDSSLQLQPARAIEAAAKKQGVAIAELDLIAVPTGEALGRLEEEELLERDGDRPDVWRFSHGMVREVAYESLLHDRRRELHARVVTAVERLHADRLP